MGSATQTRTTGVRGRCSRGCAALVGLASGAAQGSGLIEQEQALTSVALPGQDPVVDDFADRPGSLLGQLELGLGVGFLAALDAPADEVCEMVLDCVDRDTRLDWNLDERDDYHALLLLANRRRGCGG